MQTRDTEEANLRVWEPPEPDGVYVIGVDPSGGGGGEADDHAIEVLRCYADRIVQVCEFQSNRPLTYQLSWVLAHLAGAYKNHVTNLEVSGVGAAVMPEVSNLRQLAERGIMMGEPKSDQILDMIGNVRWFLYRRTDTYGGGGSVINWKTNADNKLQIYSELRDSLMLGRLELRSIRCVRQMQAIVEDDMYLGAGTDTGENDDLMMALALAHHAWADEVVGRRRPLVTRGLTYDSVKGDKPPQNIETLVSHIISDYFIKLNKKARARPEKF